MLSAAAPSAALGHDGIHRVQPQVGPALSTHGPDPRPPGGARVLRSAGFEAGAPERAPVCTNGDNLHILYGRPAGSPDRIAESRPQIQAAIRRMNAVLDSESLASGGPDADYRVRCDPDGEIAVDGFTSSGAGFSQIVSAARSAGFDSDSADYLVFFDGRNGGACGIASYYDDERLAAANRNNGSGFAAVYSGCWYGETPMHEAGHLMGAVQYGAPHSTGSGGHCWDDIDVMCYAPDGGDLHQSGTELMCAGPSRFDCGFDDYFDSAPEPGEYLAEHWNLGSSLNRSLVFGSDAAGSYPEQPPRWRTLQIAVPRHARWLEVSLRGDRDVDLYLRHRRTPTEQRFACRARAHNGSANCRIKRPQHGRWVAAGLQPPDSDTGALRIKATVAPQRGAGGNRPRAQSRTWRAPA